jgi:hypothetical protein
MLSRSRSPVIGGERNRRYTYVIWRSGMWLAHLAHERFADELRQAGRELRSPQK